MKSVIKRGQVSPNPIGTNEERWNYVTGVARGEKLAFCFVGVTLK